MSKVREYLKSRGYPENVVEGGLSRLISRWEETVREVVDGKVNDMDEYLNDLDGRQIIDEIHKHVPQALHGASSKRLETADARFLTNVERSENCLWGDRNAKKNGWTADHNWWYFHLAPGSIKE